MLQNHPYSEFIHKVTKPARYLGGEYNSVVKDFNSVDVTMCLAFPDLYDIGMSHLGTKILYNILSKNERILVERAFTPWIDLEKELRERDLPLLSLESHKRFIDFDVVGFSLQYELTFTNILTMLDLSGIPFRSKDRNLDFPLLIAGGPSATHPEAIADFIDVFLLGDAEEKLPEMLLKYAKLKESDLTKTEILVELSKLGGLYIPALYETEITDFGFEVVTKPKFEGVPQKPKREILEDINRFPFPDDSPVAAAEAIFDRMSVEIARGCTEGCRFCQAGMIYRPVRERDPNQIVDTLVSAIQKGGYDEASLTTLSTADYSCISPLIKKVNEKLRPEKVSLSVASLRAYGLTEDVLDEISSVKNSGLTFAPEAGTQRMRDVINKNISEADILKTAENVFSRGWQRVKLYFMIGLPTEEKEDIAGIAKMGIQMRDIAYKYHKKGRVNINVSTSSHVPKPHTPFQWCAMDSIETIIEKQRFLKDLCRYNKLDFKYHNPKTSYLECIIGRGDRRISEVIEKAWQKGARFDGWDSELKFDAWLEALEEVGLDYEIFLGTIPVDTQLPWDHLDMQLEEKFLKTEYKRAMKDKLSPPCGKPVGAQVHHTNLEDAENDNKILVCYHCGVACDMENMRQERKDFLKEMGSFTKEDLKPSFKKTAFKSAQERFNSGLAPHDFKQGEPKKYRLGFAKKGVFAMQGHLDLIRTIPRIFKRAGIELYYSEGFNPKPQMSFSSALSLGVEGLQEFMDISLLHEIPVDEFFRKISSVAPEGFELLSVTRLQNGEKGISKVINVLDYILRVENSIEKELFQEKISSFLALENFEITIERKKKIKKVDARKIVREIEILDEREIPNNLILGQKNGFFVKISINNIESRAKPYEIIEAILGEEINYEPTKMARIGNWTLVDGNLQPISEVLN